MQPAVLLRKLSIRFDGGRIRSVAADAEGVGALVKFSRGTRLSRKYMLEEQLNKAGCNYYT